MSVPSINPLSSTADSQGAATSRVPLQTLDQDDFLKLLVVQLSSQDPLNPKQDTDFIAQMAQFTTLEQSKAMQQNIAGMHAEQRLLQANAMLGRVVELQLNEEAPTQGLVSAVQIEAGTPRIIVNGEAYDMSAVRSITPALPNINH
jgi:flagellar basal-body rod modification protein FlgD